MLHILNLLYKSRKVMQTLKSHHHVQKHFLSRSINSPSLFSTRNYAFYSQTSKPGNFKRDKLTFSEFRFASEPSIDDNTDDIKHFAKQQQQFFEYYTKRLYMNDKCQDREYSVKELPDILVSSDKNSYGVKITIDYDMSQHIPLNIMKCIDRAFKDNNPLRTNVTKSPNNTEGATKIYETSTLDLECKPTISAARPDLLTVELVNDITGCFCMLYDELSSCYLPLVLETVDSEITNWVQLNNISFKEVEPEMVLRFINMHFAVRTKYLLRKYGLPESVIDSVEVLRITIKEGGILCVEFYMPSNINKD